MSKKSKHYYCVKCRRDWWEPNNKCPACGDKMIPYTQNLDYLLRTGIVIKQNTGNVLVVWRVGEDMYDYRYLPYSWTLEFGSITNAYAKYGPLFLGRGDKFYSLKQVAKVLRRKEK